MSKPTIYTRQELENLCGDFVTQGEGLFEEDAIAPFAKLESEPHNQEYADAILHKLGVLLGIAKKIIKICKALEYDHDEEDAIVSNLQRHINRIRRKFA